MRKWVEIGWKWEMAWKWECTLFIIEERLLSQLKINE